MYISSKRPSVNAGFAISSLDANFRDLSSFKYGNLHIKRKLRNYSISSLNKAVNLFKYSRVVPKLIFFVFEPELQKAERLYQNSEEAK